MACWADKSSQSSKRRLDKRRLNNLNEAWFQQSEKDGCILRLEGLEKEYWLGTEVGRLGRYECDATTWLHPTPGGPGREYCLGTEVGRLGGYECDATTMASFISSRSSKLRTQPVFSSFPGPPDDGDRCSEKGNMGAGYVGAR